MRSYHRPAKDAPKLFAYLFPAELLALLRCAHVPLGRRVLYALAVYTGLRKSSLLALCWSAVDWQNGMLLSRVSKTGIAQMFEENPARPRLGASSLVRALGASRRRRGHHSDSGAVHPRWRSAAAWPPSIRGGCSAR